MNIPSRIAELLSRDVALHSAVLEAISTVSPWAQDNKTIFFPEYTDHSLVHMSDVLASADSIISDESWPLLTPQDAAAITLSVLLHDCALHLTEDGFYSLINGRYQGFGSKYVQVDTPWDQLWQQFWAEARRFDHRKLIQLFGASDPVTSFPSSKLDLTLRHRLLIGEFLRRHHARLAHEIAICGIPGHSENIRFGVAQTEFFDLCGFIARSHNLGLRAAVDAIEPAKRRVHMGCRVPFVMATLRVADYLQIQSARAPGQLLALKSLSSPISRGEWKKHASVREIHQAHDDPESIFVDCEPESAHTFVGMRRLLSDIQQEMDGCWAVIGEVYGRVSALAGLGLAVRRIRSNIDDPGEFQRLRRPSYIPREFRFRTASAELMDLLVAPLYGDRPEVGVRELVQNSVDACLERDELARRGVIDKPEASDEDVMVTFEVFEDQPSKIVVEDFGVGMTPDVVDRYFLNIGASFRSSDLWRRSFEVDGHSTIHRTGRFGIGVLAAFLLGNKIRVTTRHISAAKDAGVSFTCEQGDDVIALVPCDFHHGTRIEIHISKKVEKELLRSMSYGRQSWDWYCLEEPKVERRLVTRQGIKQLDQSLVVPSCDAELSSTAWRRVNVDGYDDVMWSYTAPATRSYSRTLTCNGILIDRGYHGLNVSVSGILGAINASRPSVSVFDPDGRFPLNLQRDRISGNALDVSSALGDDIAIFFSLKLAEKFRSLPAGISKELVAAAIDPEIPGLNEGDGPRTALATACILSNGVVPTELDLLAEVAPPQLLVDPTNLQAGRGAFNSIEVKESGIAYLAVDAVTSTKRSRSAFLRGCLGDSDINYRSTGAISRLPIIGLRILVRKADVDELVSPGNVPRSMWAQLTLEWTIDDWCLWTLGNVRTTSLDFARLTSSLSKTNSFGIVLLDLDWSKIELGSSPLQPSAFSKGWREVVRSAVLSQSMA